ncbi:hypothetical protein [Rufibacter sp. XAAS-G3-1]|uniref:tetratricopeptide repeat protein n=1 Tax=Rufibacter sp. XAAS-G3-1 TaxID=2729134 RepID=UPI0015E77CA4|nr:hypothetical protein [Rufibacter sp. XAAS-G3-1]
MISILVLMVASWQASAFTLTTPFNAGSKNKIKERSQQINRQPANAQAYAERAAARMETSDVYGAIKDYSKALHLATDKRADLLTSRGKAFLEIGAFKEALQDFEAALLENASLEGLYGRSVAKYHLDDMFGAIRDLDAVIAVAPEHSKALYNRAVVKLELNKVQESISDLTRFLAYHPNHPEAEYALRVATNQLEKRFASRY